ncbi:hypothetical protein PRIPAC_94720 [Pristionchus pacificus]|uniref:RecQ_Zn_bind domain-containing protein n=1 Tax=Pristionchus pacificus TaxID=54126 RepID=A0A2A6BBK4_PRIPA|nr:hypothetical protein PRIPAC_94720 [Pristionchus pacificus]|eukprot:PDM63246.1 hypothetical protein PRIPAC_50461 [Pristionchus pacificus]
MHLGSIYQMVAYAENISICRRKILVEHFGEMYEEEEQSKSNEEKEASHISQFGMRTKASQSRTIDVTAV